MIDKLYGQFNLICDECGEAEEQKFDDFYDAVRHKKDHGWRSIRIKGNHWKDLCPDCVKEYNKKN